jgi:hypothetical protein
VRTSEHLDAATDCTRQERTAFADLLLNGHRKNVANALLSDVALGCGAPPRAEDEVGARVAQKAMSQICGAEHASHIYLNLGDIPHRSQLSIRRSGTRENSRSLSVTIVCPNANA